VHPNIRANINGRAAFEVPISICEPFENCYCAVSVVVTENGQVVPDVIIA
jgi:hypothetical protein